MRTILLVVLFAFALVAGEENARPPIVRAWLVNPAALRMANPALRAVLPGVQAVRTDDHSVYVESAGLALQPLAPLQVGDRVPPAGVQKFLFQLPLHARESRARSAAGKGTPVPAEVTGVFLNGVPIYNPVSPISWADQNLWHLDSVREAGLPSPIIASLLATADRHSPLIGFALDGFPIYGPYGWDENGALRRFYSSYRLRAITGRSTLPDGVELTPSQEGPAIGRDFPLGTFAEDYAFVKGSGALDEHNGRFAKTPEYPEGTYAYFLGMDALGRMAFPYLMGRSYFGEVEELRESPAGVDSKPIHLRTSGLAAGKTSAITLTIRDRRNFPIRYLEKKHEQPIHMILVSEDLSEFAHIHPQLQPNGDWKVNYSFPYGGRYSIYADYTRPGEAASVSHFQVEVSGKGKPTATPRADADRTKTVDGLRVTLRAPDRLRAGEDLALHFDVLDASTQLPADDLQPYLGSWAHILVVSADREDFLHVHPVENAIAPARNPWQHTHAASGPSPSTITAATGFRRPGIYRLWLQVQREGRIITVPFTLQAAPAVRSVHPRVLIPADAIRVSVSGTGFSPARIAASAGKPLHLAFLRQNAQNCAKAVVFPELGIRKDLPPGETVVVEIPASGSRELHFSCGMDMFRGSLVIR